MHATDLSGKPARNPQHPNRHPVDRLADVRAQQKELEKEEADLKAMISAEMGSSDSLGGDEFIAFQALQERKGGLDEKALLAAGVDVESFRKPKSTFVVLKVERRASQVQ